VRRLPLRTDSARYSLASPTVPQGSATLIRRAGLRARIWRRHTQAVRPPARHYERDWLVPAHILYTLAWLLVLCFGQKATSRSVANWSR
jgi:hypothetical protein